MKEFVIADLRLFNDEQRKKLNFPDFSSMNNSIIKAWNQTVSQDDSIIVMGDIGSGTFEQMKEVISQLNGSICYTSNDGIEKFTKEEWAEIGVRYAWKVSMYKELENRDIILYCINPIRRMKLYEENYKLVVVDHNNSIEGMVSGIMLSADAAKWYYSPIDTDGLLEIYENMKEFEEMKNEEHRADIKEDGEE